MKYSSFLSTLIIYCSLLYSCSSYNPSNSARENSFISSSSCKEGETRNGYLQPVVNGFEQCVATVQTCHNGQWNGPSLYSSCNNPTESCGGVVHGTVENGYSSPVKPCYQVSRTCLDGAWTIPIIYHYCQ